MSMTRRMALTAPAAILGSGAASVSAAPAPPDITVKFSVEGLDQAAVYAIAAKLWDAITAAGVPATESSAGNRFDFDRGKHFTAYSATFETKSS